MDSNTWSDENSCDAFDDVLYQTLSPLFPCRRPDDAFFNVSHISHVDNCNQNLFYSEFSCMYNIQLHIESNICTNHRWLNVSSKHEVHRLNHSRRHVNEDYNW